MKSPVAWIPSTVAADRLRQVASSLVILNEGVPLVKTISGVQLITHTPEAINHFPIGWNSQTRTIELPGIYVDFVTWQYLPPQKVTGGPNSNQKKWLRIAVDVDFDPLDFWDTVSIGEPRFEWVSDEYAVEETGSPVNNNSFMSNDAESIYYRYIVRIFEGERPFAWVMETPLVNGFPSLT